MDELGAIEEEGIYLNTNNNDSFFARVDSLKAKDKDKTGMSDRSGSTMQELTIIHQSYHEAIIKNLDNLVKSIMSLKQG